LNRMQRGENSMKSTRGAFPLLSTLLLATAPKTMQAATPYWECLSPHVSPTNAKAGCNGITDRTKCLTSRDGRTTVSWMGVQIADQPCVWCGGKSCTDHGDALCEPADFMFRGQALGVWKVGAPISSLEAAQCPLDWTCLNPYVSPSNPMEGCNGIQDRATCLVSRDGRATAFWMGIRIADQPCVWCRGRYCTDHGKALCEPADFMLKGQALRVWSSGVPPSSLEHATCPLPGAPPTPLPPSARGAVPNVAQPVTPYWNCLNPYFSPMKAGCNGIRDRTSCLRSRDGRAVTEWRGIQIADQPCAWCGGEQCTDHGNALCEPADFMLKGQALGIWTSGVPVSLLELATCPLDWKCLTPYVSPVNPKAGCNGITDRTQCLTSRDGRKTVAWIGIRIADQPCVWCGGAPCTDHGDALCEPADFMLRGQYLGVWSTGIIPSLLEHAQCPTPTRSSPPHPFPASTTVPPKPSSSPHSKCLNLKAGCNSITNRETCQSRDGRTAFEWMGIRISNEPCVWCGGEQCTNRGNALCEPADFMLRGQKVGVWRSGVSVSSLEFASCLFDTKCLKPYTSPNNSEAGCNGIRDRTTCLASRDGRARPELMGVQISDQPCVWCGGKHCTSHGDALCEPADFMLRGQALGVWKSGVPASSLERATCAPTRTAPVPTQAPTQASTQAPTQAPTDFSGDSMTLAPTLSPTLGGGNSGLSSGSGDSSSGIRASSSGDSGSAGSASSGSSSLSWWAWLLLAFIALLSTFSCIMPIIIGKSKTESRKGKKKRRSQEAHPVVAIPPVHLAAPVYAVPAPATATATSPLTFSPPVSASRQGQPINVRLLPMSQTTPV